MLYGVNKTTTNYVHISPHTYTYNKKIIWLIITLYMMYVQWAVYSIEYCTLLLYCV